jgi:formylglycine-generating enzyme required for sulfatase activity
LEVVRQAQEEALANQATMLRAEATRAFAAISRLAETDPSAARPLLESFIFQYKDKTVSTSVAGEEAERAVEIPEVEAALALLAPKVPPRPGFVLESAGMKMISINDPQKPILVSETEVLQGTWELVMGTTPSSFFRCGEDCPVEQVSWVDAVAFCNALSAAEGLEPAYTNQGMASTRVAGASGYHLPNRAEWQAITAGGHAYAGSDNAREVAWTILNSERQPHRARQLRPSSLGLFDVSGNVAEWLEDGNGVERSYAGGSWSSSATQARVDVFLTERASFRGENIGFRLVRDAPQKN